MDFSQSSSPAFRATSLPPRSLPEPSLPTNGVSTSRRSTGPTTTNALDLGEDIPDESTNDEVASSRRRRRTRGQINVDVPIVKDAVGESVRESFETFLKT